MHDGDSIRLLLRDGNVDQALDAAKNAVRRAPSDGALRILLFQLFCVLGRWESALNQLAVLAQLPADTAALVGTYRELLRCEITRERIFAGQEAPLLFGHPDAWAASLIVALKRDAAGQTAQADQGRLEALQSSPDVGGQIDASPFAWIADTDSRLGPMLEAVINGHYYWVPFDTLSALCLEGPQDLRDLVWMPASFTFRNGGETVGFIPTRYCGTTGAGRGDLLLARRTEWDERGRACGQRVFATDMGDVALLDMRQIRFAPDGAAPLG